MARTLTCDCGETITGTDDVDLLRLGKQHMAQKHPDMKLTEEQMQSIIKAGAKDA